MFKTIPIIVMATLCLNLSSNAQEPLKPPALKNQGVIGEVISSSTNEPLPGALIKIAATNFTVVSNEEGEFNLSLANGTYNLAVHYLTYKTRNITIEIPLKDKLIIALEPADQNLKEVEINAGYYTVKDRERTGSISRITSETISRQPVSNPLAALVGRLPGVQVQQTSGVPGAGFNVQVRGRNSIGSGTSPLYIVNGIPFPSTTVNSQSGNQILGYVSSPLGMINPGDIESIEVLKDADATAIYGAKGANGVVLIKTKTNGNKKTSVHLDMQQGIAKVDQRMKLLNTNEYLEMRNEAFANDNASPGLTDYDLNGRWDKNKYINWQDYLIGGTSSSNISQISLSAGTEQTKFLAGIGYNRETTVFPGDSQYSRKSTNLNITHNSVDQKFKANFMVNYAFENNNIFSTDLASQIFLPPNAPEVYDQKGNLNWEDGTWNNPLAFLMRKYLNTTDNLVTSALLDYKISESINLKTTGGFTSTNRSETQTNPLASISPFQTYYTADNIYSYFSDNKLSTWILEPQIFWKKKFGYHTLNALIGATFQENIKDAQRIKGTGFSSDELQESISSANRLEIMDASYLKYRYQAVFGRINYNYRSRYLLNLTARRDGSSRFGPEKQMSNFAAIGAAWVFTDEPLFGQIPFLSFGKLRFSYGTSGNDQISDYGYLELWSSKGISYDGKSGLYPTRIANPDFAWEVNKKFEAALELGFFANRILLETNFYNNRSSNQLVNSAIPPSTGFQGIQDNLKAVVQNSGWEFSLKVNSLGSGSLTWNTNLNFTIPRNKLVSFPNFEKSNYFRKFIIGSPLDIQKVYHLTGVNPETGIYQYADQNGNGSIEIANDLIAAFTGQSSYAGLTNFFTYKGFELDFMFQFVKQKGINYKSTLNPPGFMYNQPSEVMRRWQEFGDHSSVQKFTQLYGSAYSAYYGSGDLHISDASFIRLKNVSLGWSIPVKYLQKLKIKNSKLIIRGQNLLTISNYMGNDPESQNIYALPPLRQLTAGFQIYF